MPNFRVTPRSITEPYLRREGDFAPDLVGQQFTNGTSLFTLGNFAITTNVSNKLSSVYHTGTFSEPHCLDTLNLTPEEAALISNDGLTIRRLNLDETNLDRYVYFGSFFEFIRVNIEQILLKWKGSIYLDSGIQRNKNTVLSYSYDPNTDTSKLILPTSLIKNDFGLITGQNTSTPNEFGDISNLSFSFDNYVLEDVSVSATTGTFKLLGYTGDTSTYPYINISVSGNPFPSVETVGFGSFDYHVRPSDETMDRYFFNYLSDFELKLLNRLTNPKYTYTVRYPYRTEDGVVITTNKTFTWPTSDGFNLDSEGGAYTNYLDEWIRVSLSFDENETDLVARRFISESIREFDTDGGGDELTGRKVNKLLRIYGREWDEVKKYVDGISFARRVTYDKKDNVPDELIKQLASAMGFDTILTLFSSDLFVESISNSITNFSGYSRSLTIKEMDTELWRRLVINAWWLFKSKGHRKVIEFLLNLFGIDKCVISLDEYVYVAREKLDLDNVVSEINRLTDLGLTSDIILTDAGIVPAFDQNELQLSQLTIDNEGFPKTLPNTQDYYFQMNGFWWNGGEESTVGNNPHYGPYDYGKEYFDKFRCFIDDFDGGATGITNFTTLINYFTDYSEGTIEDGLATYSEGYAQYMTEGGRVSNGITLLSAGMTDLASKSGQNSFRITFTAGNSNCELTCPSDLIYYENGILFANDLVPNIELNSSEITNLYNIGDTSTLAQAALISQECCQELGGWYLPLPPSNNDTKCPNTSELQITTDGIVLGIKDETCCTKTVVGSDVTWDGRRCVLNTKPITEDIIEVPTETVSAQKLFEIEDTISYACYWCPQLNEICTGQQIVDLMSDDEVVQDSISKGFIIPPVLDSLAITQLRDQLADYYQTNYIGPLNGCLLVYPDSTNVSDEKCCIMRGGTLSNIDDGTLLGTKVCIKSKAPDCPTEFTEAIVSDSTGEYIVVTNNGQPLTEECCNLYSEISNKPFTYDGRSCKVPICPNLTEEREIDLPTDPVDSVGLEVRDVTDPSNPRPLSQVCCEQYAEQTGELWYYDTVRGRCVNNNNTITEVIPNQTR